MLRDYQLETKYRIYDAWRTGARVVAAVLPTGAGKTVLFSDIIHEHRGPSCAIAHRQELVTQISQALARDGVYHRIVGPNTVVRLAVSLHTRELGRSYFDPSAQCAVAGVDTLIRRGPRLGPWAQTVTLWVQDECHHLLTSNKWGKAISLFPHARGLGVTATPTRADGRGLGRHADGVIDSLVVGPGMRELIHKGYLTDYRVFAPPSDIDLSTVQVSHLTGDYNRDGLRVAVRRSHIVGDVVAHYGRIAPGCLGVTFASDVQTATDISAQYKAAGIPSDIVHAKTSDIERVRALEKFKRRELLQLVNVDLFGEGFDLPAIEVVSMARPTQSYGLYAQQFGRALRPMRGKTAAIIIDHVGNVVRHGLPDRPRLWTLDRRERRTSQNLERVKVCPACTAVYERVYPACPFCGFKPEPLRRDGPEWVDGDLTELDAATLAQMRGEIEKIDKDPDTYRAYLASSGIPPIGQAANMKRHHENQAAQHDLRNAIALWAGYQRAAGRPDAESYRRFWLDFGIDVLGAQALKLREARALETRINLQMGG